MRSSSCESGRLPLIRRRPPISPTEFHRRPTSASRLSSWTSGVARRTQLRDVRARDRRWRPET
eukprot:6396500-Alexandrium_andersonii.AAC.1